jgi:erythrin-vacuolar iron transport family protein
MSTTRTGLVPVVPAPLALRGDHGAEGPTDTAASPDTSKHLLLQVVQPGLAGLMDGSVSTLAPIFATAFVTHRPITAFLVGIASATGAGISMAFSEALSDDGTITGRGNPILRGSITGGMTFLVLFHERL